MTQGDDLQRRVHRLGADVPLTTGASLRLLDVLAGEDAEGDRDLESCREIRQSARHRAGEHIEMRGLSAYQAAKRHDRVKAAGGGDRGDCGRKLERAGDLEFLDFRPERQRPGGRSLCQATGDLVVPAGTHDRHPGADKPVSHSGGRLPTQRHLAQSSPRMTPLWAAR